VYELRVERFGLLFYCSSVDVVKVFSHSIELCGDIVSKCGFLLEF
jgi:hypothetical protein